MCLIYLLVFVHLVPWSSAQSCESMMNDCVTLGSICECSGMNCIPVRNPCGPSTTDMVFIRSFINDIPEDAFLSYNITFLAISGMVGLISPGAFNGLDRLKTLRINSFSMSASSKSWSIDIDMYISYSNGFTGLQSIYPKTLNKLPSMTSLDLNFNRISHLNEDIFSGFDAVEEIGLAGNSIEKFDETIFQHVPKLKTLYLTKNRISHMVFMTNYSHNLFRHLENLDLFGNRLTTFPSFILEVAPPVINIDLRENPLICDCNTIEFLKNPNKEQQILGLDRTCNTPEVKCSAPKISSSFKEFDVLLGESMVLDFEIKGQPHPFVSITGPDGLPRVGSYNIITNQVLVDLYIANDHDFGTYTCSARNSYGSTSFDVVVKIPPTIKHITTISAKSRTNSSNSMSQFTLMYLLIGLLTVGYILS